ncbi:hypothetical protein BH23PSE1_BH23PSE1_16760 [soil metagenome]
MTEMSSPPLRFRGLAAASALAAVLAAAPLAAQQAPETAPIPAVDAVPAPAEEDASLAAEPEAEDDTPLVAEPETGEEAPVAAEADEEAPESILVFFDLNQTAVSSAEAARLEEAARLFRDGQPTVMIVGGGTDTTGSADLNLAIATERARSVIDGLAARGIPIDRMQLVARGQSDLVVSTEDDVAEPQNRVVEITWR